MAKEKKQGSKGSQGKSNSGSQTQESVNYRDMAEKAVKDMLALSDDEYKAYVYTWQTTRSDVL